MPTVAWRSASPDGLPGSLEFIDQTRLPQSSVLVRCDDAEAVRSAIQRLVVRGAPAIGVAGAYGLVVGTQGAAAQSAEQFAAVLKGVAERLRSSRPTAVNLAWAVDRCVAAVAGIAAPRDVVRRLLAEAVAIHAEDEAACAAMGRYGATLLREGGTYLTHCNTGRLAATGIGTAFGVFVTAKAMGLRPTVYVGEVRPLLQGARLTAFELRERGIDGFLMPDSAAGSLLRTGAIEAVFVGADRIAANGDSANKIGTYPLAELARANGVPFYVVAPTTTIDASIADGSSIPIESRGADEVRGIGGVRTAPDGFPVHNPAFDVTPAHLISGIVTERGIARAPYAQSLRQPPVSLR
ncbi:MAG: S-methyl-5-thioribose-1-phosphate isomerase [Planctomycetes bacterium]|nr:S-methyl-5-thioribose-1-phosphate isomerase [Planctomycetota bacterium]